MVDITKKLMDIEYRRVQALAKAKREENEKNKEKKQ